MPELYSFFSKVTITPDKFKKFQQARPAIPCLDDEWKRWWAAKEIYDKRDLKETDIYTYGEADNKTILDKWVARKESYAFYTYNPLIQTWHFAIPFFTENYYEMIPVLAFIRSVAEYKEEDETDFALVYPYAAADPDDVPAVIKFNGRQSAFMPVLIQADRDYATEIILSAWRNVSEEITGGE